MKEWKIRAVQEENLAIYARKLQSVLNRMELDGFDFTVESPGISLIEANGKAKLLALVTGSRDKIEKIPVPGETLMVEEK